MFNEYHANKYRIQTHRSKIIRILELCNFTNILFKFGFKVFIGRIYMYILMLSISVDDNIIYYFLLIEIINTVFASTRGYLNDIRV